MSFLIPHRIIVLHYIKPHHKDGVYIKGLVMETYFNITFRLSTIVNGGQFKKRGNVFSIITCSVTLNAIK